MLYEDESKFKKGKKLATGTGVNSMMDKSYKNNWSNENTILEVKNPSDLNSRWNIYEKIKIQKSSSTGHLKDF